MKTNLIYMFADQWRYHALGVSGEDQVATPCMNHFAEEGVNFTNAYSTFPLCTPHRGSLMTGKYPLSIGLWTNCKIGLEEVLMLKPQEVCIGNVLQAQGYRTGYIGKWHLDASEQNFEPCPESGARHWDAYTPPGERRQGFDYWLSYGADDHHLNPHYWRDSPKQICPGTWSVEYETDQAIAFIGEHKGKDEPFALFVSYNPPHLPYDQVPERYYSRYRKMPIQWRDNVPLEKRTPEMEVTARQYYAAVAGIDEQFGRVMEYLKTEGLEENTLVVLSADHGEMMGSHGLMQKNVWYDEAVHIPLVIRHKGRIVPGSSPVMVASPDHMPTLLQLLGIPVPETCEGYGHAASLLCGADPKAPEWMFLCSFPGMPEMVGEFARRGLAHKAYGWRGILTPRYTYVATNGYDPGAQAAEYLYDRASDPYQRNPQSIEADDKREEIVGFRRKLEDYLIQLKDPFLCRWKTKTD